MHNPRTIPLLLTVLFIAVILSGTIVFGITALIGSPDNYTDTAYHSDYPLPENLTAFDRGVFLQKDLREFITAVDYRLFKQTATPSVLVGRNHFLFPRQSESSGKLYDYLTDYTGNALYSEAELDLLAKSITMRSIAYRNQGADYILAVIPNLQTIYGENLPALLGASAGQTRLEQLQAYLTNYGEINFLNLTDALRSAKTQGQLYNNTEDSLNALGAINVYRAVLDAFPNIEMENYSAALNQEIHIFTRYIDGKALARRAGVEKLIQNRTLSLANDTELKYQILERVAGTEITYAKPEYRSVIPNRPILLLEFSQEWDKIQLMPYFSNTFGIIAYKNTPAYSKMALEHISPSIVVQFIHENELDTLLDKAVMLSYNDGLHPGDDPFRAMTPIVLGVSQINETDICIVGRCEEGSTVRLSGDGIIPTSAISQNERFVLCASLQGNVTQADVTLSAVVEGKQISAHTSLTLSVVDMQTEVPIIVGKNSMLFRDETSAYLPSQPYTRQQLRRIGLRFEEYCTSAARLTGTDTQLVHIYIPDKRSVYREALPALADAHSQTPRIMQLIDAVSIYPNISAFDLTEPLRKAAHTDLTFRLTDDSLTPIGAYAAYYTVMDALSAEDPRLKPLSLDSCTMTDVLQLGGDLLDLLNLDKNSITEKITVLSFKKISFTMSEAEHANGDTALIYQNKNSNLPRAIVLRDACGTPIIPYLAQHFSQIYVLPEENYTLSDELLQTIKPDYIFSLNSEYHLPLN